ncbi:MAG: translation initiation factor [Bradyrhizobiaceae bacterium]|nr:translation initiation factor [Bradyrhizobiaceae bacterium]
MPGLEDLAKLLGTEPSEAPKQSKKTGYDGKVVVLKVRVEQRRGKTVTIAWGFQSKPAELNALLAACKKKLGAGGQVTDNALELQGDHKERLREFLKAEGYAIHK